MSISELCRWDCRQSFLVEGGPARWQKVSDAVEGFLRADGKLAPIYAIWAICEIMPRKTSALGQLYDTLGVFGVVQGANEVMLKTLEQGMDDTDQHIRQWLQGGDGKYQPVKIDGAWHKS